jgi:hypothetical protein
VRLETASKRRRSTGPKQAKPMLPSISRPFEVEERVIPPIPNVKTYSAKEYNNNRSVPSKKSHHLKNQNDDDDAPSQQLDLQTQQEGERKRRRKEKGHHNHNNNNNNNDNDNDNDNQQQHEDTVISTKPAESPQPKLPLIPVSSPEKKNNIPQERRKSMLHFASVLETKTSSSVPDSSIRNPLAQLGGANNNNNKRRKSSVSGLTHQGFGSSTLKKSITGKSTNSKSFRDQMSAKTARDAKQQALQREKEFQELFPEWPAKAGGELGSMSL